MGAVRVCLLLPLIPLAFLAVYREKDWKCWLFFGASALTVYAAALMGNGYCHYFTLAIPNLVFAGFLLLRGCRRSQRWRRSWQVICLCLSCLIALDLLRAQWPVFRPRALEEIRYAMYCALTDREDREDYGEEIQGYLRSSDARWVVTGMENIEPEAIQSILKENYQDVFQSGDYRLWVKEA